MHTVDKVNLSWELCDGRGEDWNALAGQRPRPPSRPPGCVPERCPTPQAGRGNHRTAS